jgi:hypothetical protein
MFRAGKRAPALLLVLLVVVPGLAGCGAAEHKRAAGSGDRAKGTAAGAASGRKPDADGLVEVSREGVSLKVPATWELSEDTTSDGLWIWVNPKCKTCGLVALSVDNSNQSAEDFVSFLEGKDGTLRGQVKSQRRVDVEGLGRGYLLHTQYKKNISDRLVVATMDGLLVMVIATPDAAHPEYADLVLSSVSRKL